MAPAPLPRALARAAARRLALAPIVSLACDAAALAPDAAPPDAPPPVLPAPCPERPTDGVWALLASPAPAGTRYFRASLTSPVAISGALASWRAQPRSAFPLGVLRCKAPKGWNCGWRWHLDPERTELVESAMELCDAAAPVSDADCEALVELTGGLWCPWSAQLVELRDCRAGAPCAVLAR